MNKQLTTGQKMAFALVWVAMLYGGWTLYSATKGDSVAVKSPPVVEQKSHSNADVYATAETIISQYLKAPATAKFPGMSEVQITRFQDGFRVDGYVDSQNSYGALIRSPFSTLFQFKENSDAAIVLAVVLDGETLLKRMPNGQ